MTYFNFKIPRTLASLFIASALLCASPAVFAQVAQAVYIGTGSVAITDYTVLKNSGNVFLVKNKSGRQALLFKTPEGEYKQLGFIGKIKRGAELYHWGNGTPEQAEAWDKAGRISTDLLNHLKANDGGNMMGGGFYASVHKTDSISYGNVQIVIEMPQDVKVLVQTPLLRGWNSFIPHLEILGISAIQHPSNPTWFNFVDANALTKEHVTKARAWKNVWEISQDKEDLIRKFPEIYTEPSQKADVLRYLNYWKMLASPDENVVLEAYKYFVRISDTPATHIAFKRFGSTNRKMMANEAIAMIQSKRTYRSYYQFLAAFSGDPSPEALEVMKAMFQSSDETIRSEAMNMLMGRKDIESLKLIKQGINDSSPLVRSAALSSVGNRELKYSKHFIEQLIHDSDSNVRGNAWTVLGNYRSPEILNILRVSLKSSDPQVRMGALKTLGSQTFPEVTALIKKGLLDADPQVRAYTIQNALPQRRNFESNYIELLEIAAKDTDPNCRRALAAGLFNVTDPRMLDLIKLLITDADLTVKKSAITALRGSRSEEAFSILKSNLHDSNPEIRATALDILSTRQEAEVMDILKNAYHDSDPMVQRIAISRLMGKQHPEQIEYIKIALQYPNDPGLHQQAVGNIRNLPDVQLDIIEFAFDVVPEPNLKGQVLTYLMMIKGPESFDLLKRALKSPEEIIRQNVVNVLGYRNEPEAIDLVRQALNDPSKDVKERAQVSLIRLNTTATQSKSSGGTQTQTSQTESPSQQFANERLNLQNKATEMTQRMCSKVFLN